MVVHGLEDRSMAKLHGGAWTRGATHGIACLKAEPRKWPRQEKHSRCSMKCLNEGGL